MKINVASEEVIHFVGIGGIGMSGLAQIMNNMGFQVQGSDLYNNKNIERLKKIGVKVFIGHHKKNLKNATIVVISSAIKKNNVEFIFSKKRKIPIFKRGEILANVVSLKKNIVIAGAHGKTKRLPKRATQGLASRWSCLHYGGLQPIILSQHHDTCSTNLLGAIQRIAATAKRQPKCWN